MMRDYFKWSTWSDSNGRGLSSRAYKARAIGLYATGAKDAIGDLRWRDWIVNLLMERGREGKPLYIASPFVFSYIYIIS